MATQTGENQILGEKIFRVPVQTYDVHNVYTTSPIYFASSPMGDDTWENQMLKAHARGKRISYSREWSGTQRYMKEHQPEQELKLLNTPAWTGTVLDFNDETLKERISLNPDGSFREARIVLARKDGILLPSESAYVKDLDDKYMPLVAHLHGLRDPKRELPDCAYLWINPKANRGGINPLVNPLVRGRSLHDREATRVVVDSYFDVAFRRFAAWLVDEKKPDNVITPAEYAELERRLRESTVVIE